MFQGGSDGDRWLLLPTAQNVPAAREHQRRACDAAGVPAAWSEIVVMAERLAGPHARGWLSYHLVGGKDVTGAPRRQRASCRICVGSDVRRATFGRHHRGAAPLATHHRGNAASFAVIPGALLVLPVVSCPSCWPAYAGVLGSLGVPFLMGGILAAPSPPEPSAPLAL